MSIQSKRRLLLAAAANESDKDPYIANTEVLIHTDGFDQQGNDSYIDSANNHIFSTLNGPIQGSFSPFSVKGWTGYFDGNGDRLEIPYSSQFTFGTGDFTIECWIYRRNLYYPAYNKNTCLAGIWSGTYGNVQAWLWYITAINGTNELRFINNHPSTGADDQIFTSPATIGMEQWYHIAVTREGNVWRTFVNGVQEAINSNYSTGMAVGSNPLVIGDVSDPTSSDTPFKGYISNFRIAKGIALYTSNFTVPAEPLNNIAGTNYTQKISSIDNPQGNFTTANADKLFDGSLVNGLGGGTAGAGYAQVNFSGITWSSSIEVAVVTGSTSSQVGTNTNFIRVNGYDIVPEVKAANNFLSVSWVDITSKLGSSGTLNNLGAQWISGVANPAFYGIKIDGVVLKDSFTVLLTLQDATIQDNSASNHSITINGDTGVRPTSPFSVDRKYQIQNYFSGKFNGTDSTLTALTGSLEWSLSGSNSDFTTSNLQDLFEWGPGTKYYHTTTEPLTTYFRFTTAQFERGGWIRTKKTQQYNHDFSLSWTIWDNGSNSPEGWSIWFIANNTDVGRSHTMTPVVNVNPYPASPDLKLGLNINNWYGSSPPYDTASFYDLITTPGTSTLLDQAPNGSYGGQKYWWWDYDHSTGTHNIYFSSSSSKPASPLLTGTLEMPSTELYLYFGAGCGGNTSEWRLLDYSLSITNPVSTSFDITSGDFTVEAWVKRIDSTRASIFNTRPASGNSGFELRLNEDTNATKASFYFTAGSALDYTGEIPNNAWFHIAATRSGNTGRLYIDGVKKVENTNFSNGTSNHESLTIGHSLAATGDYFNGYISNARMVKGTAYYTGDSFPLYYSPLDLFPNTTFLSLQDNYTVDHARGALITNNNVEMVPLSPFDTAKTNLTNFSMYVDGTSTTQGVAVNSTGFNGRWFDVTGTQASNNQKWTVEISHLLDEFSTAGGLTSTNGTIPIFSANSWYGDNIAFSVYLHLTYNHNNNGKWAYFIRFKTGFGQTPEFFVGDFIGLNKWHNMAISFGASATPANSRIRTFMNGKLQTNSQYGAIYYINQSTSNKIHIGRWMSINTAGNPPSTTTYGRGYYHGFRATREILYDADYDPSFLLDRSDSTMYQLVSSIFEPSTSKYNSTPIDNPNMENVSPWEASSGLIEKYKMQGYASSQYHSVFSQSVGGENTLWNSNYRPFYTNQSYDYTLEGWVWIDNFNYGTAFSANLPSMVVQADINSVGYSWGFGVSMQSQKAMFAYSENSSQSINFQQITHFHSEILTTKRWYHLALVARKDKSIYIYVNGKGEKVGTWTGNWYNSGSSLRIGQGGVNQHMLNSYISNVRITKNYALYTNDFTPPTEPLGNVPGTVLLIANTSNTSSYTYTSYDGTNVTIDPGNSTNWSKSSFNPFKQKINSLIQTQGYSPSAYFDSTTDRVNVPSSSNFTLSQVQWTVEAFIYLTSYTDNNYIVDARSSSVTNGWHFFVWGNNAAPNNVGKLCFTGTSSTYQFTSTNQVPLNRWVHVCVTRRSSNSSTSIYLYIDGKEEVDTPYGNFGQGVTNYQDGLTIGNRYSNTYRFYGYISNFRLTHNLVEGFKSQYYGSINVSSNPLTNNSDVRLLTLQDNDLYSDNSSYSNTITNNGSTISTWGPFNTTQPIFDNSAGSVYFYGSGDTIYTDHSTDFEINAVDFTIEGWFYVRDLSTHSIIVVNGGSTWAWNSTTGASWYAYRNQSNQIAFEYWNGSTGSNALTGGTIKAYNWYHFAVCGKNSTQTLYLNGVQVDQNTSTTMYKPSSSTYLSVGSARMHGNTTQDMKGSISGLRIVKGTCLYNGNFTVPQSPPHNVTNTKLLLNFNNAGVVDSLGKHNFMLKEKLSTPANQPATTTIISTDQSKFGETSADCQDSSIRVEANGEWIYLPGDSFTWEKWMYIEDLSVTRKIFQIGGDQSNNGYHALGINTAGRLQLYRFNGTYNLGSNGVFTTGNWFHFAWVKNAATGYLQFYKNGSYVAQFPLPGNNVGNGGDSYNNYDARCALAFPGTYNEEIRITNGVARYTSNFTPPSRRFPNR